MDSPSRRFRASQSSSISSGSWPRCVALFSVLLVAASLVVCLAVEASKVSEVDQDQQLSEQPNRQFFKVHLMSGESKSSSSRKLLPKLKASRQQNLPVSKGPADQATAAGADEPIKAANTGQEKQSRQQKGTTTTTTISSATLKKLLNQALLKSSLSAANNNATDSSANSGQKTSKNFKFVFIQRATSAPNLHPAGSKSSPTTTTATRSSPPPHTSANEQSSPPPADSSSLSKTSSLAASVSKQLATSLLNSAVDLVANLSLSPSLSSLASQIVAANSIGDSISPALNLRRNNSTASASDLSAESSETNRREQKEQQQQQQASSNETGAAKKGNTRKGTKSKPSKIYNLPVKFVANGQPNHVVVFHTLKEHFATIKRLQAMGSSSGGTKTGSIRLNKERKQQQQQKQRHKLKGTNSRLIYLPLRYLSNAKPNKIMITGKAAHKSSADS